MKGMRAPETITRGRALAHWGLALVLLLTQLGCVSTGPQRLSRDQAGQIRTGEAITLGLQDGTRIATRYLGQDETGVDTTQGRFSHERILFLEVERFSAGETAARTAALYIAVGVVGAWFIARALRTSLENRHE